MNGSNGHPDPHMNRSISYNGHSLGIPSKENGNGSHVDGPLNDDEPPVFQPASHNGNTINRSAVKNGSSINGDSGHGSPEDHESRFRQKTPLSAVFAEHMSLRYVDWFRLNVFLRSFC